MCIGRKISNVRIDQCIGSVSGFSHALYTTAISSNEAYVACGGEECVLRVYDLDAQLANQTPEFLYLKFVQ